MPSTKASTGAGGRGVSRLTSTVTASPAGTPNTPAEIGWMPHHSRTGPLMPSISRSQGWVVAR